MDMNSRLELETEKQCHEKNHVFEWQLLSLAAVTTGRSLGGLDSPRP